ncbi:hypothetical protein E3O19_05380 [Cryobacterium algoritolerans]|uniref:Uncharacterized protein n=1 Tax=Cryobacterium algoritolerans TaxID=1259184 RepID=A0A4R8WW48_9MICO|nr:hypothetical protein [Cryobacterium algoritolerans]TFC17924.1 hypothetical protein E3O19_05380 [Cryobacterium algoritolerans]
MAEVDRNDDTIWRWVLHHYRFDLARRERRNVVVAAYDSESEFQTEFERYTQIIRDEIARGTRSSRENLSGVTLEPGHLSAAARGHNARRAIEHGVSPERVLTTGALPHNMAVLTFTKDDMARSAR